MRGYICDVCGEQFEGRSAAEFELNSDARSVGGKVHYSGGPSVEWPRRNEWADLCPEHAVEVAEVINELDRDND